MDSWLDEELSSCVFKDKRLTERFKVIVKALSKGCGHTIPQVCEEWAMAKSTYRFLSIVQNTSPFLFIQYLVLTSGSHTFKQSFFK